MISKTAQFSFAGSNHTFDSFKASHMPDATEEYAADILEVLLRKGQARLIDDRQTKEEKVLFQVAKEEEITMIANGLDAEESARLDRKAGLKREGKATYENVDVEYPTYGAAVSAKEFFEKNLRLHDIGITQRQGLTFLSFQNITDADLNYINRSYMAEKAVAGTMDLMGKGVETVTGTVDYTARKIVSPAIQIGVRATGSILKSLFHTGVKTGATLVHVSGQNIRDTKEAISNDSDVIKAQRELIDAKDSFRRAVGGKFTGGQTSGITIR